MHSGWNGTYEAFEKNLPCWQPEKMKAMLRVKQFTEDCLVMNINAPISPGLKPVLVNIHGGAFNSLVALSVPKLAEAAQAIFVAPQYRLGVLGFLATESPPSNLGMQDQAGHRIGWRIGVSRGWTSILKPSSFILKKVQGSKLRLSVFITISSIFFGVLDISRGMFLDLFLWQMKSYIL